MAVSTLGRKKIKRFIQQLIDTEFNIYENDWLQSAEQLSNSLGNLDSKERFWHELLNYFIELKLLTLRDYPCFGYIYFRLGVMKLMNGKSYSTVLKYLNLSFKHDKKWEERRRRENPAHPFAQDQSAFRVKQILKCLLLYKNSSTSNKREINRILNVKESRYLVHTTFTKIYDRSIKPAYITSLSWKPFDKLLGRNNYRCLVEQNYRAALYLCSKLDKIHRKLNLEQYGLAMAVISLCGSTVEGILAKERKILKLPSIRSKPKHKRTFGSYVWAYIENLKPSPELKILFLFLLSIRNQIHPPNRLNRTILLDMRLANFVYRLTEEVIISLAKSSKKREWKKWYAATP